MNTNHGEMQKPEIGKPGGQESSIVRFIRTFLGNMAEANERPGATVLKELLQNADDAGATEIEITLDVRPLPKQETPYDLLLVPSLLIRNNAMFMSKEELKHRDKGDFEALLDVAGGHKTSDSVAAGRFGIGFNSVYFLTDNPVIFSRDEIHFLDLLHHLPFNGENGWIFSLDDFPAESGKSAGAVKNIVELCFPKTVLIQDTIGEMARKQEMYKQSVFRLPIRTDRQEPESISDLSFKDSNLHNLFNGMIEEAPRSLLFLKTIDKIIFSRLDETDKKIIVAEISITPNPHEFKKILSKLQNKDDYTTDAIRRVIRVKTGKIDDHLPFTIWHRIDFTNQMLADKRRFLEKSDKAVPWVSIAVPGSKEAMTIDGSANPNWRVFLPLLEEGPCGCLFSGAFFVGPSRQKLDYKTEEGIIKTQWNQTLVKELLVPLFCEKSIEIPEVAELILSNDPKAYLSLFPAKAKNKEAKNLSDYTQACFQNSEETWYIIIPDLWGKKIEIWKGEQNCIIEKVPEWLIKYKMCFEHFSNPSRRFVTESLGRALGDRYNDKSNIQDYSPDLINTVLRDKDAIDVSDLDKLWERYATKSGDDTSSQTLYGLYAFTEYDSGALIEYDAERLFIVVPKSFSDPVFSLVKSFKAGFSDVCWINETGLAKEAKNFSDIQNIYRPSRITVLELLRRINIDDHKAIELKNNDLELLVDFLVERKTSEVVDLKLGFLIKIASNKERFVTRKSVFIRPLNPTNDDEAFWNVWFKSHFSELDPHVAKQIRRLLDAHPHIIDMIKTSAINLVEATSSRGIDVLIKAIMADKPLIEELASSINSQKEKAQARRVSEYIIERAMNQWDDWDVEKQNCILDLPIHRAVDGKYISLKADEDYWLQSKDSADLDAPITLEDRPILNPQSQFVNEFYANTLKIEYNGRLSIIKQALKQIGLDNIDNQALLVYIVKYYPSVIDTYPDEVSELKELLLAANIVLCSDGEWRPITEAYNPARVIDILCEQGWKDAEAQQVVKAICSNMPITDRDNYSTLFPFLRSQSHEIQALTQKQFSQSIVTSKSIDLSIQQIIKLVTKNRYNDEFEISGLIQQSDLPTLTGSSKLHEAKLLLNRINLSDRLLRRLIPNLVDVPKLSDTIGISIKDVQDALKYLRVREITSDYVKQKFVSQFTELWDSVKTNEEKLELLVLIEEQDAFDDLRDVISTIPIIQSKAQKEPWTIPEKALTPDIANLNPPLISETELPSKDVPDKIIALYSKICGINSFSLVFSQILCKLASSISTTKISEVYMWLSNLLNEKMISNDELVDCLKTNNWVLANQGGKEDYLEPNEVLICDASSILKHHFYVPVLPIPDNLINLNIGFQRSLPETPDDLRGVCQAILESGTTDEDSYIALYKMIVKLLTDDELKQIWLEEASNNPLILTFREKKRFSSLYGLFIGNDEYIEDLSSNLLCLKKTELPKIVENLYMKLGVENLPSIRHIYYALSEFEAQGDAKDYRKLVDLITKYVDLESINPGHLKVKTLAGTYNEISGCYNASTLINSGSVVEGLESLIDINDASTRKLVDWIHKIEPFYPKELQSYADYSIQSQDDQNLMQQYEAVLDAWMQLLYDLNRGDSLLIEKLNERSIEIEPVEIRIKTAGYIEIKASTGNTKISFTSNDQNWFCSSERDCGEIIIKPSPTIDYQLIDSAITKELLFQLGIDTTKDENNIAFSILQDYLERPSSTLRRISKDKKDSLLVLYKNEVADPEFNEKYRTYVNSSKRIQQTLIDQLIGIASENYINERRKTILGHGYDKNSIVTELLQNAEDAYKQAKQLGMEIPEVPYFSIYVADHTENKLISVEYQGRPFNYYKHHGEPIISFKQDIEGLLRSSGSFKPHANKGADPSNAAIGKFGLGFKCVYLITDSPVIHSGHWHFKINHTCIPEEIAPPENWSPKKTRIELPINVYDITNDIDVDSIWKLLPFLHHISKIEVVINEETCLITRIEQPVQTSNDMLITSNEISIDDSSICRFIKISRQHAQLALLLDEADKPLRWLSEFSNDCYSYLPLASRLDFGVAVSNQFSIQSGRTHLLKDEENTACSCEIKQLIQPLLEYLVRYYADNVGFWKGFWEVFKYDSSGPETERIKSDLADSLSSSMQKLPIIPTLSRLVSLIDCRRLFYFSDEVLSSVREVILKSGISLNGAVITPGNTAEIETITRLKAILKLAEQDNDSLFIKIDVDTLIDAFKGHPILAETPDILNIIADERNRNHWHFHTGWLSECKVLKDGDEGFDFPANLYIPSITYLAYLPINKMQMISSHYNEEAIELLSDNGLKTQPDESELIDWISSMELSLDQCVDLIRYLHIGNRYTDYFGIKEVIQGEWIPFDGRFITPKTLSDQESCFESLITDSVFCSWLGIYRELQQEQAFVYESKQIDTEAVLTKISNWWKKECNRKIVEYNKIAYPDGLGLKSIGDQEETAECKSDWLKLLLLGSLHTIGRAKIEQHREYLSKCIKSGMFNMGFSHKEREDRWLNSMLEIIDSPNDNQQYYHWIGFTGVRFFQFNRWLDDYISVFQDINKYKKTISLETLMKPRSNSSYSGTGIEPPSVTRALGTVGIHFVLRELVRHEVIKNDVIYSQCFVPSQKMKEMFKYLSNGTDFESSNEIMAFLTENMPDNDATFGKCFDIPFQMIIRDDELLHELVHEDIDIEMEDEDDI